jgi:hypothetical protein
MPAASEVHPGKWSNIRVLFDNGWYSVIAGEYRDDDKYEPAFGERWNGKDDSLGFPNQAGHPIWHVIPRFLVAPILRGLLEELKRSPYPGSRAQTTAITRELQVPSEK